MYLSPSFLLSEFTKSPTATRLGIKNEPDETQIENMRKLCKNVLQPVRNYFHLPLTINSGFRSLELNNAMGGAMNSQHMLGQAADIEIAGVSNDILWQYIKDNLQFDQLIAEYLEAGVPRAGWVHVSFSNAGNRKEALSCIGKRKYVNGLHYVN